jgi:hypothetical protein
MGRWKPLVIGQLIIADFAILLGTPFLESVGDVPRHLAYTFGHFDTDPRAAALPLVRLLLGAVLLAAILDLIWSFSRPRPRPQPQSDPQPLPSAPKPIGWQDVQPSELSEALPAAAVAVRDRWHDLPAWTWVGPEGMRILEVADTL